jgi:hypothetical protein
MSIFDLFRRKSGTASPSPDSERGDWIDWFLNREGPAGRFRGSRRPRYGINYLFNDGGSVNPHEETKRAARDWSPREQYISRSNRDRTQDAAINRFIREGQGKQQQWEQEGGQGAYPVLNEPGGGSNFPVSPGWMQASSQLGDNSGVMAAMANNPMVQQAKGFYNLFDPWMPNVDVGENSFGYEFEKPILGGTLGYGFDYDWDDEDVGAFFNWKKGLGG